MMGSFGHQRTNCFGSTRVVLTGLIALIVFSVITDELWAQPNSLRPPANASTFQDHHYDRNSHVESLNANTQHSYNTYPPRDVATTPVPNHIPLNSSVRLTDFQAAEPTSGSRTNVAPQKSPVEPVKELPWQDPNRILDLIMNISLNLVFVLSFAFGAILLAKKWLNPSADSKSNDRLDVDSLSVLQTLRLDQKISVRLIQWRSNRFLIACDQNGIQSVNALNESFDQTLTELESDDQVVSKLLASLESVKQ